MKTVNIKGKMYAMIRSDNPCPPENGDTKCAFCLASGECGKPRDNAAHCLDEHDDHPMIFLEIDPADISENTRTELSQLRIKMTKLQTDHTLMQTKFTTDYCYIQSVRYWLNKLVPELENRPYSERSEDAIKRAKDAASLALARLTPPPDPMKELIRYIVPN